MEASDYNFAWAIYISAAILLSFLSWVVLKRIKIREFGWLLQSWLLALLFTPWYVVPNEELMAPALMVFAMDAITIDPTSGIRALIPLVMAMMFGVVITLVLSVATRLIRRKKAA